MSATWRTLLQRLAEGGAPPDDLAEVAGLAELRVQVDVLGLQALTETLVLRQGGPEGELGVPAGKGAGDDLADQPEAGDQVRRPALLARDRREEDDADDTILDHHRCERARRDAVAREGPRSRAASGGSSSSLVRAMSSRASNSRASIQGNASRGSDTGGPGVPVRTHRWVRVIIRSAGRCWMTLARSASSSSATVPSVCTIWASMASRRHADQARREPADYLVELDGASERVVGLLARERAPE